VQALTQVHQDSPKEVTVCVVTELFKHRNVYALTIEVAINVLDFLHFYRCLYISGALMKYD
jgi:hypothetical protein